MRARLAAGLIASVILLTGVMPAVAGYRCVAMGARMQAPSPCCHHQPEEAAVKAPCCEAYAAPRVEPRRSQPSPEIALYTAPVAWVIASVPPLLCSSQRIAPTLARGRPPGELLQLFSTIQRV